ncbi:MAG TPA: hypothetical protein VF761_16955 [Gemmatimonadaceae bacterium]
MKIRLIALAVLVLSLATAVYACGGGNPFAASEECWIVVVETGVGSRCGRIYHYGIFKSADDAEAWAKEHAPAPNETTYVTPRRVEIVAPQPEK